MSSIENIQKKLIFILKGNKVEAIASKACQAGILFLLIESFLFVFSLFFLPSTPDIIVFYNYASYVVTITVGIIVVSVAIIFFVRTYNFLNRK